MYIDFRKFLGALCVVGLLMGAVFGSGIAIGRGERTSASAAPGGGAGPAAAAQATSVGQGALGGAATTDGAGAVAGTVEEITPTSMVVRTAAGSTVTVQLNAQTAVRKTETGSLQDVQPGDQVLVARDAASIATTVQLVPPGGALPAGRGGAGASAAGTPGPRATPR